MATAASVVLDRAELILKDSGNDRWTEAELLDWCNEGQRIVVILKPDANPVLESVLMSSGTEQSLPTNGIILMDATYNMGDDGSTVGDAVTIVDRAMMDACYPGWQNETTNAAIKHVIYDPAKLPKKYWIYPQSDGTNYLQIITSKLPTDVATKANNLSIDDEYVPALTEWVLYRAFSKDAEYNESDTRANNHLNGFRTILGIQDENETGLAAKRTSGGLE